MKIVWLPVMLLVSVLSVFAQVDKPIITVLDFEVNEVSAAEMKSITGILSSALFQTDYFTVIDVSQRDTVLKEMEFSMSGCSDESCMLEIGKLLSAEAIVVGSIGRVGTKYVFSAKMLETETARTISTADGIYTDLDELLENINGVAMKLSKPYGAAGTPRAAADGEPEPETTAEPSKQREPLHINIPAVATLAGGLASAGAGAYFLIVSLPLVMDYLNAKSAYDAATDAATATSLWETAEAARAVAVAGNANTNFLIGTALAGAGIALSTVSVILFTKEPKSDKTDADVAFLPIPGAATVAFNIRY